MSEPQPPTAPSLVDRCRRGDQDAWRELVATHSRYVYAIIRHGFRISDRDAEDLFQDTFARVFESLETLRDDAALKGWVAQIARNLCLDHLRRAHDTAPLDEAALAATAEPLAEVDRALGLHQAMAALPPHCAEILDRFFSRDETYQTIGAELAIPPGTIASRISRCLSKLRESISQGSKPGSGTSEWME